MLRRTFLCGAGALAYASGAAQPFRLAICNETYGTRPFAETCRSIQKVGYTGIEIAPFTLAEDPVAIPAAKRREYSSIIRSEGLKFASLHWLLRAPAGLHATTADPAIRERSWRHMRGLIDLCADLGPGGVMVLGSPQQRAISSGVSRAEAVSYLSDGLAGIAPHAVERGVKVLIETFTQFPDDPVRSLDEAAAIVHRIGSPGVQMMFDTNNASKEVEPHAVLVDRYFDLIHHIHLTEKDGPYPGAGNYDFKPLLKVLRRRNYSGWLSVEVFDFKAGGDKIAQESFQHISAEIAGIENRLPRGC